MKRKHLIFGVILCAIALAIFDSCKKTDLLNVFMVDKENCIGCEKCVPVCPVEAIYMSDSIAVIDPSKCIGCTRCAKVCPPGVIYRGDIPVAPDFVEIYNVIAPSCTGCKACLSMCMYGAITIENDIAIIDTAKCVKCGYCIMVCDYDAIEIIEVEAAQ